MAFSLSVVDGRRCEILSGFDVGEEVNDKADGDVAGCRAESVLSVSVALRLCLRLCLRLLLFLRLVSTGMAEHELA